MQEGGRIIGWQRTTEPYDPLFGIPEPKGAYEGAPIYLKPGEKPPTNMVGPPPAGVIRYSDTVWEKWPGGAQFPPPSSGVTIYQQTWPGSPPPTRVILGRPQPIAPLETPVPFQPLPIRPIRVPSPPPTPRLLPPIEEIRKSSGVSSQRKDCQC